MSDGLAVIRFMLLFLNSSVHLSRAWQLAERHGVQDSGHALPGLRIARLIEKTPFEIINSTSTVVITDPLAEVGLL